MLLDLFPALGEKNAIKLLQAFYRSWVYVALVSALMVLSAFFGLELVVFYLYFVLCAVGFAVSEDALPLIPIAVCSYTTISVKNNPAKYLETSVFYQKSFQIQFLIILILAAILLLLRLITAVRKQPKKKIPFLLLGFVLLGLAYIFGGSFSGYFEKKSAFFGFTQIASLCALYFYFYYAIDWRKVEKRFIFVVFTAFGFGILLQIAGMYLNEGAVVDGVVNRGNLYTGWGIYNNVGCVMAMCIPAPFYLAAKLKRGWIFTVVGIAFMGGVMFTRSRGSILFGSGIFAICALATLIATHGRDKLYHLIVFELMTLVFCGLYVFKPELYTSFWESLHGGDFFGDSGRWDIYMRGLEQFSEHPLFGVGFYQCENFRWGDLPPDAFLPARYHDTYVQLLASGGVIAFVCYFVHRIQTLIPTLFHPNTERTFAAIACLALIVTSILDCNFFNFGPPILYSILLVFLECLDGSRYKRKKRLENPA